MWPLLVMLIVTPTVCTAFLDHYPPGYYFTDPDFNTTDSTTLFYVEGAASYQTVLLSSLKPELEAVYRGCGAVPVQHQVYLTHARYQRFPVTELGPGRGSGLTLYTNPGSELHYCALQETDLGCIGCLTPAQQRLVQCLQKKLPPPNQQFWDKLVAVILWSAVLLMKLLF